MKVLVVAPHADDEVLGCGGFMAKLAKAGHEVHVLVMCDRSEGHSFDPQLVEYLQDCCRRANAILGVKQVHFAHLHEERLDRSLSEVIVPMERYIAWLRPTLVLIPHRGDVNQDHRAVFEAALVATRTLGNWEGKFEELAPSGSQPPAPTGYVQAEKTSRRYNVAKVMCYEVISTTEQAPPFGEWAFTPNVFVDVTDTIELKLQALSCYTSETDEFPFPRSLEAVQSLAKVRGVACALKAAEAYMLKREIVFDVNGNGNGNGNGK